MPPRRARAKSLPAPSADAAPPGLDNIAIIDPLCSVFRRKLKGEGLKYTPERALILDVVMRFDGLFEAERVLETVRESPLKVSKATVYRTLRLLQEAGIIQRVPFDDEQTHYQVVYGHSPKDVLIRLDTRELVEVEIPELVGLRDAMCARLGLVARGHRLQVFAEKA